MKQYLNRYKMRFILVVIGIVFSQLLLVLAQQLNGSVFDELADKNFQQFLWVIISILIVWGIKIVLDAIVLVKEENLILDFQEAIREDITTKMTETDYRIIQEKTIGSYLSWLNNDLTDISQKGFKQVFNIVRGISGVVFAVIAMLQYHWSLLFVTGIGFICMFYVPKLFDQQIYKVSEEVSKGNEQLVSDLEDQLNGYPLYFAFSSLVQFVSKIKVASHLFKKVMMKQVKLNASIIAVNFSINVFFQILLTFMAAICYFHGWVPIGAVAIVGVLADIVFSGLGNISYQITSTKSVKPIFDKHNTLQPESVKVLELSGEVIYEADKLSLNYGKENIFNDLTFKIYSNTKCLISGSSGSGKSSLLKLLLGYNKDFDGDLRYKGHDMTEISSKSIAKEVCYLSQQSYVFKGTVKENIQLGDKFSDDKLVEIISLVGFENKESILFAEASELSGGQKQRLALARALIRSPKIIICDEITSALDQKSSSEIENILLSQKDLTVIMITHVLQSGQERFDTIIKL